MTDKYMTAEQTKKLCNGIRTELDKLGDELDYLKWFKQNADFGPADSDVHFIMDKQYTKDTGKQVPADWVTE